MSGVSEPWSVPGYDVEAMLGFGATGEVWRARDRTTGETVALKRLREGADPAALEALRREATLLRTLDTPYVVRLRAVVGDVLVLDHAPGGSLGALLTRRGCLDPGEVVTIAVPLARALAVAHAQGLVHGDVSPANVLFTADGMPLLADLGVARVAGEGSGSVDGTAEFLAPEVAAGGEPGPAADVWALAALCHHLLAGTPPHAGATVAQVLEAAVAGERAPLGLLAPSAPRALVAAVEAGLAPVEGRPDAEAFAGLLRRAHAMAPVRLTEGRAAFEPVRPTHVVRPAAPRAAARHRRLLLPRRALPGIALGLLVLLAALVGWVSGRGEAPVAAVPTAVSASPGVAAVAGAAGPVDWEQVLTGLDDARAAAFERADPALLARVWSDSAPGLAADRALLAGLARDGRSAHGLRHELRDVKVLEATAGAARLAVVDVLADHEVRDNAGAVVQRVSERGSTAWRVRLVREVGGWRLAEVAPVA